MTHEEIFKTAMTQICDGVAEKLGAELSAIERALCVEQAVLVTFKMMDQNFSARETAAGAASMPEAPAANARTEG